MTAIHQPTTVAHVVAVTDPRAEPLLRELAFEYLTRYGTADELTGTDDAEFTAPNGALVLLEVDQEVVAGGGFRRLDEDTAELKRVWTHSAHRRRGHARQVLGELEELARERGYSRLHLTTGPRQPEANALYLTSGFRALFDVTADAEKIGVLRFEKQL
ncbi:GNAT family N-acetyltransferase [Saccharothrix violaceirubra]|uniref:GNAT superfamily N-acetyltransferase n=1 Tax=Saccharothrix violaceirubra TaxID=413306 RepID=A0A7W7T3X6_9PSEU|nr:GNAT family N-acetyltransferase [Saccharothrix violaceirubra]MBB4966083.1 GNAT superfamily N-acetyltransferase [Saccharothrix violaceirubra]